MRIGGYHTAPAVPALLISCVTAQDPTLPEPVTPPPEVTAQLVAERAPDQAPTPVSRGELPWWHDLEPGVYRLRESVVVLAVGDSEAHHHVAEGFLDSRVAARLEVRRASEHVGFRGAMPEPRLLDLFITRRQRFLALYEVPVPEAATLAEPPTPLSPPPLLEVDGPHRLGRHIFEGERHLFMECDVEGPIANPDWGRSRASARY